MILWRKIEIIHFIILIPTPDFPHFYYMLSENLGSLLYGDVSVMKITSAGDIVYLYISLSPVSNGSVPVATYSTKSR